MKYGGIKLTKGVTRTVKIIGSAEKMKEESENVYRIHGLEDLISFKMSVLPK